MTTKTVVIEVGGEHGDGNVELVEKPKGVQVIIRDWDNAHLEGNDEQDDPLIPQVRVYEEDVEI